MRADRLVASATIILIMVAASGATALGQSESLPGPDAAPVPVTGTLVCEAPGEDALPDGEQLVTHHTWDATDPRLSGNVAYTGSWQLYEQPSGEACSCAAAAATGTDEPATYRIVNDAGSWLCATTRTNGPIEADSAAHTAVFHGEGGYEGLTAYLVIDWSTAPYTWAGLIMSGDVPEYAPPGG